MDLSKNQAKETQYYPYCQVTICFLCYRVKEVRVSY